MFIYSFIKLVFFINNYELLVMSMLWTLIVLIILIQVLYFSHVKLLVMDLIDK